MIRGRNGFTIIEVIIFLAISAAMFSIGFLGLRGRQDSVAFRQAINDIDLKIKETFNNVDNGYFGNAGQYNCRVVGGAIQIEDNASGGGNSECVFFGKMISFSADGKTMSIDTIIGDRLNVVPAELTLQEQYNLPNAVQFSKAIVGPINPFANIKLAAIRDDGVAASSDLRAMRYYFATFNEWPVASSDIIKQNLNDDPKLCFKLGDKRASIIITQKDTVVDYNGEGCND